MIRAPVLNPATSELGSSGFFLMAFSRLTSVTGSSVSDVVWGPRSVSVDVFEIFYVSDQNKKVSDLVPHSANAIFNVLVWTQT